MPRRRARKVESVGSGRATRFCIFLVALAAFSFHSVVFRQVIVPSTQNLMPSRPIVPLGQPFRSNRTSFGSSRSDCGAREAKFLQWWDCRNTSSTVRIRHGGSYDVNSWPVLDMEKVIVSAGTVHVFGADEESRSAVEDTGFFLRGESLRAARAPDLKIQLHDGPFPAGSCDPCEAGERSLFFVKPWFWHNLYHLMNDASMVLHHVRTTPPELEKQSSASHSSCSGVDMSSTPSLPRLLFFGRTAKSSKWGNTLFGHENFPGGSGSADEFLNVAAGKKGKKGEASPDTPFGKSHCVRKLHWGAPLRVMSGSAVSVSERRYALTNLRDHVEKACPLHTSSSSSSSSSSATLLFLVRPIISSIRKWFPRPLLSNYFAPEDTSSLRYAFAETREDGELEAAPPRALFVVRPVPKAKKSAAAANRWFTDAGLGVLTEAFKKADIDLQPCCNFKKESPCEMVCYNNNYECLFVLFTATVDCIAVLTFFFFQF